jgi:hypothetical protein
MTIAGVAPNREDRDFEDWLTAMLIENTDRESPDNNESCLPGIANVRLQRRYHFARQFKAASGSGSSASRRDSFRLPQKSVKYPQDH